MTTPDPLALGAAVAYCGWDPTMDVEDETIALDGTGRRDLFLPSLHVTDVSSVSVVDAWDNETTPTIGPGQEVGWSENGCLTWNGWGVWPAGQRNVTVVYSGGYPDVPADLAAALASISKRTGSPAFGATTRKMGSASVGYGQQVSSGDFLATEQMVLDKYRIVRIGSA